MRNSGKASITNFFANIRYNRAKLSKGLKKELKLSQHNWKWISFGALFYMLLFSFGFMLFLRESFSFPWLLIVGITTLGMPLAIGGMYKIAQLLFKFIPEKNTWLIVAGIGMVFLVSSAPFVGSLLQLVYFLFPFVFIFGALSNIFGKRWQQISKIQRLLNVFFLGVGGTNLIVLIYFLAYPGSGSNAYQSSAMDAKYLPEMIIASDPGLKGENAYSTFFYGSGKDKHRKEFAEEVDLVSESVDGSKFISDWDQLAGKIRSKFWGFGPDSLPLNGRVWMPDGEGPFPLALIVHGNHIDRDFSDVGYAYIAEHLASHGVITVSIDQNFLNSAYTDLMHPLKGENDARGWMMLKHLELIRNWNENDSTLFFGKVNFENCFLIGHSRGGEAVSIAAAFNNLEYYPDNFKEKFNFKFKLKGIVSIAQVDGQYKPSGIFTPIENVNYLALHGSHDADLTSYHSLRQMNRINFTDSRYHFKCGIYIYGANHGQFNSSWGKNDIGYPNGLYINRKTQIEKTKQEKIALIYITAFLKASMDEQSAYLPLLRDYRSGRDWLPETRYYNQFADSKMKILADFEEDLNLLTSSLDVAGISFGNLAKCQEKMAPMKSWDNDSKAVFLGWNNEAEVEKESSDADEDDSAEEDEGAVEVVIEEKVSEDSCMVELQPGWYKLSFENAYDVSSEVMTLCMDVTALGEKPGKREREEEGSGERGSDSEQPLGFCVLMVDVDGDTARVSTMDCFPLDIPEEPELFKLKSMSKKGGVPKVPQHIEISVALFEEANVEFDAGEVKELIFEFSIGDKGVVGIDNIGFQKSL